MLSVTALEGYWEFFEFETDKRKAENFIDIYNQFNDRIKSKYRDTYISPHSLIRAMQSDITDMLFKTAMDSIEKIYDIYMTQRSFPYGKFIGPFKIYKAALERIEMKNRNLFVVFKVREEPHIENRLDIISIGIPGVRPRNSKKPDGWEFMTNEEKLEYFKNRQSK